MFLFSLWVYYYYLDSIITSSVSLLQNNALFKKVD